MAQSRRFRPFAATVIERTGRPFSGHSPQQDRPGRERHGGPRHSRYDCAGRMVRRGSQVSPTPDGTVADPDQIIADLKRQLAECKAELNQETAERDAHERELVDAGVRQAATAEVLQIITSSRGDLVPVCYVMLERAAHLCDAGFGILWTYDGERFHAAALHGVPSAFAEFARNPISVADSAALGDVVRGHEFVHVTDLARSEERRVGK